MTQREFNNQWTIEELPACDRGMVLLKAWVDATPDCDIPLMFEKLVMREVLSAGSEWARFHLDYMKCYHCNQR